jgi:hypothetical protein
MWRRYGDAVYTLLTLAVFGFETIALGVLSLSFLLGKASGIVSTPVEAILLLVVISSASALALLGLYLLSYHYVSSMRDRHHADQVDTWTEWWVGLALAGPEEPVEDHGRKLPRVAVDSVLSLLEAVKGEEGDRLKEALAGHGVDRRFLRRVGTGHLTARLDAIEGLGKARLPQALDALLGLLRHAKPVVRRMAARAAAGTLAVMPPEPGPDGPHERFIRAIRHADLQPGVVQEALLLLETRAGPILRELLSCPTPCAGWRWRPADASAWPTWPTRWPPPAATPTPSCGRPPSGPCAAWARSPRGPRPSCCGPWRTRSTSSASRPPTRPPSWPPRPPSRRWSRAWRTRRGGSAGPPPGPWPASARSASPPSGGRPRTTPSRPPVRWPFRSCWRRTS